MRGKKSAGDYWTYCDLAKREVASHHSLLVDLGECYEHGWGQLPEDREAAINYYDQGARWGDPRAVAALRRLGATVPEQDLYREEHRHLDERRAAELRHTLALVVVGSEKSIARHPHRDPAGGALIPGSGTNIASSPAFSRYIAARQSGGSATACALVYVEGRRVESAGSCE